MGRNSAVKTAIIFTALGLETRAVLRHLSKRTDEAVSGTVQTDLSQLPQAKRWARIYPQTIDGWESMSAEARRGAATVLRDTVRARIRSRKRRAKVKRGAE